MRLLSILLLLFLFMTPALAAPLTLDEALSLADNSDPALTNIKAKAQALGEKSIADEQLPDPKASMAFQNFPTDNFSRSREGMTQIVLGASQAFPRGRTLTYKSQKTGALAMVENARHAEQKLNIAQSVRKVWLDLYYWQQAAHTVERSEVLMKKVIKATETHYGTGRRNAQDVIGAELELSVLQDKKIEIHRQIVVARSKLAKWIGQSAARRQMPKDFPELPEVEGFAVVENYLLSHPKIQITEAMIRAEKQGVKIAEEQYKPGFNLGVNYGLRDGNFASGSSRPDFVSAKLTFDVPFFTGKKQGKNLSASRYKVLSATYNRDDILRNLKAMLESEYANYQRYDERAKHYNKTVIKQANENFDASLRAYQENRSDFSSLIRAQVMELDTKLKGIKFKIDKAKATAALLYLQGDKS